MDSKQNHKVFPLLPTVASKQLCNKSNTCSHVKLKMFLKRKERARNFLCSLSKRETTSGTRNEKRSTVRKSIMLILALDVNDLGDLALFVKTTR